MALSVGNSSKARGNGANTATTAGIATTGGAGSVFLCGAVWYGTSTAPATFVDNKSNTWTQVAAPVAFTLDVKGKHVVYKCIAGAGGAGHTVTATFTDSSGGLSMFFVELLGFTTPSINAAAGASDLTNPFSSGSVSTTAANAVLVGFTGTYSSGTESRTWSGLTEIQSYLNGATDFTSGLATQIVSATGSYAASYTDVTTGGNVVSDEAVTWIVAVSDTVAGAPSDQAESTARRQLRQNAIYRMSPASERAAQQFLTAQKRANAFPAAA